MRFSLPFAPCAVWFRSLAWLLLPLLTGGWSPAGQMMDGAQSTLEVEGPVASAQQHVFMVTLWVVVFIFVTVGGVLAYTTIRFRARNAADDHAAPPPQHHGNPVVEISLISASILMLLIIAVPTVRAIWYTQRVPANFQGDLMTVRATGFQWWFKFEYPGFGGLQTANELVLPVGTPVRIDLRTMDVMHSFWVPKLAGKVDMIPNRGNFLWLKAEKTGYYWGQCAEFCGESHGNMRLRVVVLSKEGFADWVRRQRQTAWSVAPPRAATDEPRVQLAGFPLTAPEGQAGEHFAAWNHRQSAAAGLDAVLIARGRQLFREKTCLGCHTIRGHDGVGITGPDLTHVASRTTIAGAVLENTPANLKRWILHPNEVKPGNKMWFGGYNVKEGDGWKPVFRVSESEADALVAYLQSLR